MLDRLLFRVQSITQIKKRKQRERDRRHRELMRRRKQFEDFLIAEKEKLAKKRDDKDEV